MSKQNELAQLADAVTVDGSNVGIGTSSPSAKLEVLNTYASNSTEQVRFRDNTGGSLDFYGYANATKAIQALDSSDNDNPKNLMLNPLGGNVGIGTSSPTEKLHIESGVNSFPATSGSTQTGAALRLRGADNAVLDMGLNSINTWIQATDITALDNKYTLCLNPNGGNVIIGTSTVNAFGATFRDGSNYLYLNRDGGNALFVDRGTSGGSLVEFRRDGTTVGSIGTDSGVTYYAHSNGDGISISNNYIFPSRYGGARDNQIDIGISWARWDNIYATNGTIQTSDFNEKQDIASLTATEMLVGKRISALFKTFRWKDRVAEKGDNARTHTGVIAQDVQAAFTAEGLDAGDYALFISSTWWEHDVDVPAVEAVAEVLDEDGNVTTEAVEAVDAYTRTDTYETEDEVPEGATSKTRMGIRYPELLSFVAAYNEQRFASIEARLTALEA